MGIIGVVAALTIPNLNQSTGDREKVAKVKKIYSNLEDAFGRATAVYGPVEEWFNGLSSEKEKSARVGERVSEFMKVTKNCGVSSDKSCFSSAGRPKTISGSNCSAGEHSADQYEFQVADGTSFAFDVLDAITCIVYFDIDGPQKGKNVIGNDVFALEFEVKKNQFKIYSEPNIGFLLTTGWGENATSWVLTFGNMDYLKVDKDGKCNNNSSRVLNATTNPPVTSCK